jgi:hypothetical protein
MAAPVGRPRKEIDFTEVDKLCALHCTAEEIAGFFEITTFTLDQRIKEQQKPDGTYYKNFLEYFAVKSAIGKITLRRLQWTAANRGNVTMQMFLGKNIVGQTEKQQIDIAGVTQIKVTLVDEE